MIHVLHLVAGTFVLLAGLLVTHIPTTARQPPPRPMPPAARTLPTAEAGVQGVERLEMSANGAVLVIEEDTRYRVTVWDIATGRLVLDSSRLGRQFEVGSWTVAPDGKRIALRPRRPESNVELREIPTGRLVRELPAEGTTEFSPDGRFVAVRPDGLDAHRGGLLVCEVGSGRICYRGTRSDGEEFGSPVFLPGDRVGFQTSFGVLRVADLRTGVEAVPVPIAQKDRLLGRLGPGGMWVSSAPDGRPQLIDPTTGRHLLTYGMRSCQPASFLVDVAADGSGVVAELCPRVLTMWDGHSGRFVASFPVRGGSGSLDGVSLTGNGRYVVTRWSKTRWSNFWGAIYDDQGVTILTRAGRETRTDAGVRHIAIDRAVRHLAVVTGTVDRREKDSTADPVTLHDAAAWLAGGGR